jgi:hypothetical protein
MNNDTVDPMIVAALRDLDPAPATALTAAERERAEATLTRILATPSPDQVAKVPGRPHRRRTRLLVSLGLVGAAGAAVPVLLLGGGSAFASRTPTPEPLTGRAAAEAATTCRAALRVPDQGEQVVIAERRGGWTYVLLAGPQAEASCLMPDDLVGQNAPTDHQDGFFGNYDTDPVEPPTLPRDRIDEAGSMEGNVSTPDPWPLSDREGWFNWVEGYAGNDVTGITVHTPIGTDVEASVANGRFAAWWPSAKPSSENPEAMEAWTYTVTLADGTTRQVTS